MLNGPAQENFWEFGFFCEDLYLVLWRFFGGSSQGVLRSDFWDVGWFWIKSFNSGCPR